MNKNTLAGAVKAPRTAPEPIGDTLGKVAIRCNVWGNWYGYRGGKKTELFHGAGWGDLSVPAKRWLADQLTGEGTLEHKLLYALSLGPVRAIGGTIYPETGGGPICNNTQLAGAIRNLGKLGLSVSRIDSGGSPVWRWEESKRLRSTL